MVVDANSEKIIYSNTEFGVEPLELSGLINRDMIKIRNEKPYK